MRFASARPASSAVSSSSTNVPTPSTSSHAPWTLWPACVQLEGPARFADGQHRAEAEGREQLGELGVLAASGNSSSRRVLRRGVELGPFVSDDALVADGANPQRFVRLGEVAAGMSRSTRPLARSAAPSVAPRSASRCRRAAGSSTRCFCSTSKFMRHRAGTSACRSMRAGPCVPRRPPHRAPRAG